MTDTTPPTNTPTNTPTRNISIPRDLATAVMDRVRPVMGLEELSLSLEGFLTAACLTFASASSQEQQIWAQASRMVLNGLLTLRSRQDLDKLRAALTPPAKILKAPTGLPVVSGLFWVRPSTQVAVRRVVSENGWGPGRLSKLTGINPVQISRWLHGHRQFGPAHMRSVVGALQGGGLSSQIMAVLLRLKEGQNGPDLVIRKETEEGLGTEEQLLVEVKTPEKRRSIARRVSSPLKLPSPNKAEPQADPPADPPADPE